jgi:hypothetical protein
MNISNDKIHESVDKISSLKYNMNIINKNDKVPTSSYNYSPPGMSF